MQESNMAIQTSNPVTSCSSSALELHRTENFVTLRSLCEQFYRSTHRCYRDWNAVRSEQIKNDPDILSQLNITIPPAEMRTIFDRYHVIALRYLRNSDLLIFCGNKPIYMVNTPYSPSERESHAHEGFDTVDFNLLMNPSCVSEWPADSKASEYLSTKPYETVNGENMSVLDFRDITKLKTGLRSLAQLLKKGGTSQSTYSYVPHDSGTRLGVQYVLWGNDEPLWSRVYKNILSPSWYFEGMKWHWNHATPEQELKLIQELAQLQGLEAVVGEPTIRQGVLCGSKYVTYDYPVTDYPITFTLR
jgi:hypothetical protein